jgi:hypothetical protein
MLFYKRLILLVCFGPTLLISQNKVNDILNGVEMSGDWFLATDFSKSEGQEWENKFIIKRSYFTLEKEINGRFSIRYTQDIAIDKEGNDAGNVETRMKYLYLKIKPKWEGFISSPYFEIGMVHRPWITYEQKVNVYRVQGNMPSERNKLFNSAGFGILFGGNIGPKMNADYLKNVNGSMKGKFLSYAIGIYNGGGYASFEENSNKVFEGAIHFRPFSKTVPQIQLSQGFNIGKGNTPETPDFNQYIVLGGYFGKQFRISGQYQTGKGDFRGSYVEADDPNISLNNDGYSFFGEYIFKNVPIALF